MMSCEQLSPVLRGGPWVPLTGGQSPRLFCLPLGVRSSSHCSGDGNQQWGPGCSGSEVRSYGQLAVNEAMMQAIPSAKLSSLRHYFTLSLYCTVIVHHDAIKASIPATSRSGLCPLPSRSTPLLYEKGVQLPPYRDSSFFWRSKTKNLIPQ